MRNVSGATIDLKANPGARAACACGNAKAALGFGPTLLALLLPKCPLCIAAWASIFAAAGIDAALYERWRWPISLFLFAATAFLLRRLRYRYLVLGFLAVAVFGRLVYT